MVELQSSGPFSILKVLSVSLLLKWEVSFIDLHTSQERFTHTHTHTHTHTVWICFSHQPYVTLREQGDL